MRQQQSQQNPLAALGLDQNPLQDLQGLVQLIVAMQQPGQFNQELALRQQAQENQVSQFQGQQDLSRQGLEQQQQHEGILAQQWAQEYALKNDLAQQERALQVQQLAQQKSWQQDQLALSLLGLAPDAMARGVPMDMTKLQPAQDRLGVSGLLGFQQPAGMPPNLNADQQVQFQSRQKLYPTR